MHLCFSSNALAFGFECTCVLIQTALRFRLNALAFLKELRVLLFSVIGELCRGICLCFFSNFVKTIESYENKIVDCPVRPAFVFGRKFLCGASSCT